MGTGSEGTGHQMSTSDYSVPTNSSFDAVIKLIGSLTGGVIIFYSIGQSTDYLFLAVEYNLTFPPST